MTSRSTLHSQDPTAQHARELAALAGPLGAVAFASGLGMTAVWARVESEASSSASLFTFVGELVAGAIHAAVAGGNAERHEGRVTPAMVGSDDNQ